MAQPHGRAGDRHHQRATRRRDPARIRSFTERFDLDPTKKAHSYSKGNRQKVALVAALASHAELFILDEPTSGLDPLMEQVFQQCVAELRADGSTILLSSHIIAEVQSMCDAVTIIRKGRTVDISPVTGESDLETRFLSHYGTTDPGTTAETSAATARLRGHGVHNEDGARP